MKAKKIVVKCRICNKPYSILPEAQGFVGMDMCKACRMKESDAAAKAAREAARAEREAWEKAHTYTCKDCGQTFVLSKEEYEYFTTNGLKLPVRCHSCRKNRKNAAKQDAKKPADSTAA